MENPRPEKVAVVDEVRERFGDASAALAHRVPRPRRRRRSPSCGAALRDAGGELKIYKNTLVRFAARDLGLEIEDLLTGPTAIAFVDGDAVNVAKALRDFARTNPALVVKGGLLGNRSLTAAETQALADVEPREVLLAKLAGAMRGADAAVRRSAPGPAPQPRLRPQGPHRPAGRRARARGRAGCRAEAPPPRPRRPPPSRRSRCRPRHRRRARRPAEADAEPRADARTPRPNADTAEAESADAPAEES